MSILRRKSEKDKYKDEEEFKKKKRRRKIKNLEEGGKRRRKEPPKPWGKKERLLILFILLITTGTSVVLAISSRSWKLPGFPRIKKPSFNLPFFGEEKIVIKGDKEKEKDRKKKEEVIGQFKEKTNKLSGVYGLYIVNLESGFHYGRENAGSSVYQRQLCRCAADECTAP